MKEIFSNLDSAHVGLFESVLKSAGLRCFIQSVGLPSHQFYPTIYIIDDEDFDAALELLKPLQRKQPQVEAQRAEWICSKCGESLSALFDQCWKCHDGGEGPQWR